MGFPNGDKQLSLLPTKFNKLIWIKRGDYVIVSESEGQFTTSSGKQNGVSSLIQHILRKEQINHIKKEGLWPKEWNNTEETAAESVVEAENESDSASGASGASGASNSDSSDSDFSIEGNPNRHRFYVESDDSE